MKRWVIAAVVAAAVVVGGILLARRLLKPYMYSAQGPARVISVPSYPEPANNGFRELRLVTADVWTHSDAIGDAHALEWDVEPEGLGEIRTATQSAMRDAREALAGECLQPQPRAPFQSFPYFAHFRVAIALCVVLGREHERAGRYAEAIDSYTDGLRLSSVVSRNGEIIHHMVGAACASSVAPDLARCVGSGDVSADRLRVLADDLRKLSADAPPFYEALQVEWATTEELLASLSQGATALQRVGLGAATPNPRVRGALAQAGWWEANEKFSDSIDDARKPWPERSYEMPEPETKAGSAVLPVFANAGSKAVERDALLAGLRVQAAIELHRLERGALPASLAELSDLPLDPCRAQPFIYQGDGDEYVLYSVGCDMVDEGGEPRLGPDPYAGDLIIWTSGA